MISLIKKIWSKIRTFWYIEVQYAAEELEDVTGAYEYYRNFLKSDDPLCEKRKSWIEDYFKTFIKEGGLDLYGISFGKMIKHSPSVKFISDIRYVKKSKFKEYLKEQIERNNEFREVQDRFQKNRREYEIKHEDYYYLVEGHKHDSEYLRKILIPHLEKYTKDKNKFNEIFLEMISLDEIIKEILIKEDKITSFIFKIENGINNIKYYTEEPEKDES